MNQLPNFRWGEESANQLESLRSRPKGHWRRFQLWPTWPLAGSGEQGGSVDKSRNPARARKQAKPRIQPERPIASKQLVATQSRQGRLQARLSHRFGNPIDVQS